MGSYRANLTSLITMSDQTGDLVGPASLGAIFVCLKAHQYYLTPRGGVAEHAKVRCLDSPSFYRQIPAFAGLRGQAASHMPAHCPSGGRGSRGRSVPKPLRTLRHRMYSRKSLKVRPTMPGRGKASLAGTPWPVCIRERNALGTAGLTEAVPGGMR
jgi:hypothetical protein